MRRAALFVAVLLLACGCSSSSAPRSAGERNAEREYDEYVQDQRLRILERNERDRELQRTWEAVGGEPVPW